MKQLHYTDSTYRTMPKTVSFFSKTFPTFSFYRHFVPIVLGGSIKAKFGKYDDADWCQSSFSVLRSLENIGVQVEITGIEHIQQLKTPCVVIANHMSMLETMVLTIIIQPIKNMTFIIKQSLLDYPVFKHMMRSRNPISVGRTNPRQDYKIVLGEGTDRLNKGISVVVFPQRTRAVTFDPSQFNSIGVKLAKKAKVPVVPLALLTDAWKNGKYIKEFGKIDPRKKVNFSFGKPIWVKGRGNDEHQATLNFICTKLDEWKNKDG
jgi:1-acyl-sn-glycerol-3-phosphate acyltransferase